MNKVTEEPNNAIWTSLIIKSPTEYELFYIEYINNYYASFYMMAEARHGLGQPSTHTALLSAKCA